MSDSDALAHGLSTYKPLGPSALAGLIAGMESAAMGFWKLEDAAGIDPVIDSSPNGLDLTHSNSGTAPTSVAGRFGQGFSFNPTFTQGVVRASPAGAVTTHDFAISFWLNTQTVHAGGIICKGRATTNAGWSVVLGVSGTVTLRIHDGTGNTISIMSYLYYAQPSWAHYVVNAPRNTVPSLYVNGVFEVSGDTSLASRPGSLAGAQNLIIGNNSLLYLNGALDEVGLFNRLLTEQEIPVLTTNTLFA